MPAQPACFHRLEEIFTLLWGFDTGYLDRLAVGRLFGVRQRRACVVEYHDCSRHAIDASVACATAVTIGLSLAASYGPDIFLRGVECHRKCGEAAVNSLIAHPVPIDMNTLMALKRCFNFQQSVRDPQVRKRNSMDCVRSQQQSQ